MKTKGMGKSAIPYCTHAWNPTDGCNRDKPCAARCWAASIFRRFRPGRDFWTPEFHPDRLEQPLHTRRPGVVAVSFGGDLFAEGVPDEAIDGVLETMYTATQHQFILCTKRPERMATIPEFPYGLHPLPNVILLTSVSTQADADERIPHLMRLAAAGWRVGVSVEPMLGPVDLAPWTDLGHTTCCGGEPEHCHGCDYGGWMRRQQVYNEHGHVKLSWVVCGAESGPGARPMDLAWARSLRDQCVAAGVPFAYKQGVGDFRPFIGPRGEQRVVEWMGRPATVPVLDGATWTQTPWGRE